MNDNIEMTKEEIKSSIAEQTNEMTVQEIFEELKEMDEISTKIEVLGGETKNIEKMVNAQIKGISADKELETRLGDDTHYWAVRMDSIRNSIGNLDSNNDKLDFTLVRKFHDRVIDKFWNKAIPLVFGKEAVRDNRERRNENNKS